MNRVGIFWDYENCAPPTGTPGYVVAERLRTTCGAYGGVTQFRAYLELSVPQPSSSQHSHSTGANSNDVSCPSTSLKNLTLRSELQSSGVSLIDCPHNSRKNVADSMLACDLVCFALDNPAVPQIPYANNIPSSPYSIPNTPFSAITPPNLSFSKTTIVLVSGDRDFAYPLAILKARKYDIGLIVPPGGAHPALRAQASWVLNWKDVMEGTSPGLDRRFEAATGIRGSADVAPTEVSPSAPSARRPSFASRRGSVSGSRRGSVSSTPSNPAPPPPPPTMEPTPKVSTSFSQPSTLPDFLDAAPSTSTRQPPIQLPEPSSSQLPSSSKVSRKAPMRRAAKTGSRPPSRTKSRPVPRSIRPERVEPEPSRGIKLEHPRPQPLIVPVPLTVSPVGSAGPSFAGMSPRIGRPQTPPLFSTNPTTPPPPAAPPALSPARTPPTKVPTPPIKPPTPPRDATRPLHRPPIPHVSTPRPPVPGSQQSISGSDPERPPRITSPPALAAPAPAPALKNSVLQSLLPAAPALCPPNTTMNPHRPTLTVPALNIQVLNSSTLTPATPVTPPASPLRSWTRLQPVHDDTDGATDRHSSVDRRPKKGKEKAKEKIEQSSEDIESQAEGSGSQRGTKISRGSVKLAVQVGLVVKTGEEPSAISGVDSILRSYTERTPGVERNLQANSLAQDSPNQRDGVQPTTNQECEDDDEEEEEKFHETFFASFSRSQQVVQTPPTVKLLALEVTQGDNHEAVFDGGSDLQQRSRHSTPRPAARTSNSMPILPMMQSLLAGMGDVGKSAPESHANARAAGTCDTSIDSDGITERVYSRASSPPLLPPLVRRSTGLTTTIDPSKAELCVSPSVESTYGEFRALINVLEHWRRNGADRPLRSLIGVEFSHDVYAQVGATSFKDYIQRAVTAGVVTVGGGSVQGREWISLNRRWQGLGLVMD